MILRLLSHKIADISNLFLIVILSILDLRLFRIQKKKNSMILFLSLLFLGCGIFLNLVYRLINRSYSILSAVFVCISFFILLYFVYRKNINGIKIRNRKHYRLQIVFMVVVAVLLALMLAGLRMRYDLFYAALLMGCNVIYFIDHSEKQYNEKNADLNDKEKLNDLLSSHFIYNSLMSIEEICFEDGQKAADAIEEFADYLKGNIDGLSRDGLIHFNKELQHVNTYIALQEKVMGRKMDINFDLKIRDFYMPSLCLQPLVENAFKYSDPDKNNICIRSYKDKDHIIVEVENYCSSDISELQDEGKHLGIALKTIQRKLESQINGEFVFKKSGEKVIASIILPKKEAVK